MRQPAPARMPEQRMPTSATQLEQCVNSSAIRICGCDHDYRHCPPSPKPEDKCLLHDLGERDESYGIYLFGLLHFDRLK